jgi:hypothetical protein
MIFITFLFFFNFVLKAAEDTLYIQPQVDVSSNNETKFFTSQPKTPSQYASLLVKKNTFKTSDWKTALSEDSIDNLRTIYNKDYLDNVNDFFKSRWCYRKITNFAEAAANTFLHLGSACSAISAVGSLVFPNAVQYVLFTGGSCYALYLGFAGIAKCSTREQKEREELLTRALEPVGMNPVNFLTNVTIDDPAQSPPIMRATNRQ